MSSNVIFRSGEGLPECKCSKAKLCAYTSQPSVLSIKSAKADREVVGREVGRFLGEHSWRTLLENSN